MSGISFHDKEGIKSSPEGGRRSFILDVSLESELVMEPQPSILASEAHADRSQDRASASKAAAVAIVEELRRNGFSAYFACGCVRDLLLGIPPQDFDVTTSALPE